jgi:hypothetical protein
MRRHLVVVLAAITMALSIGAAPALAQGAPGGAGGGTGAAKPVPRTADGKPDLSGIWIAQSALPLAAGEDEVKAVFAADAAAGRKPLPPREAAPYTPEAEARRQYYLNRRGIDDPMARCLLSGVPRIQFRPLPFRIVQLPSEVIIIYEIHHAFRMIPTDGRPHPADMEPSYLGESVGRWDGNTLVVDVRGFNDKSWLLGVGTIHSEKLRVTERYTREAYDLILYEAVMEDPEVLTKPWRIQERFRLRPNERVREYECIENNEDLQRIENLLKDESVFRIK